MSHTARLRAFLVSMEWRDWRYDRSGDCTPECPSCSELKEVGHKPGCELTALLAALSAQAEPVAVENSIPLPDLIARYEADPQRVAALSSARLAAQAEPVPYRDSTPGLHVGESSFEGWYSGYWPQDGSNKQRMRDAYAAGMGDPLVTMAAQAEPAPGNGRAAFEAWAAPILGDNPTWRESGPCELAWQAWQANAAQAEPVAWRPIESAPTDGTKVFLAWPNRVCVGWYEARTTDTHRTPWRRDFFNAGNTVLGVEPTHWQPLPAHPLTGAAPQLATSLCSSWAATINTCDPSTARVS